MNEKECHWTDKTPITFPASGAAHSQSVPRPSRISRNSGKRKAMTGSAYTGPHRRICQACIHPLPGKNEY